MYDAAFKTQILKCLVEALRSYGTKFTETCIKEIVQVISDLVLTSSKFIAQFVECKGVHAFDELGIFQSVSTNDYMEVVITSLQICSHLIRNTEEYYEHLTAVLTPPKLYSILTLVGCYNKGKCRNTDRFVGRPQSLCSSKVL